MTQLLLPILAVLAGLATLTVSSDRFVKGAATVARHFGISPLVIGIVIIGFGTSLPEMLVSALSAFEGSPGLALGNAYGSNIANVALILGVSGLLCPLAFQPSCQRRDLPWLAVATIASGVMLYDWLGFGPPALSRLNAILMLALFGFIMVATMRGGKQASPAHAIGDAGAARGAPGAAARLLAFLFDRGAYVLGAALVAFAGLSFFAALGAAAFAQAHGWGWLVAGHFPQLSRLWLFFPLTLCVAVMAFTVRNARAPERAAPAPAAPETEDAAGPEWSIRKAFAWVFAGLLLLLGSSYLLVWGAVAIAKALGVSDLVIGLTIVAIGTSLPELAAAVAAARQKEADLAIGNVLGSNLFNTLVVVGIAGVIAPFKVPPEVLTRDYPAMFLLLLILALCGRPWRGRAEGRIGRVDGAILLTLYVGYNLLLFYKVTSFLPPFRGE